MSRRPGSGHLCVLALGLGCAALIVAEAEWLRVAAAVVIVTGIVLGVFAIAAPAALGSDPPAEKHEDRRGSGQSR